MSGLLKAAGLTPRCDSADLRPAGRAAGRCRRYAGTSPSQRPPDAGSVGSSAAGRPTGTAKSLWNAKSGGKVRTKLALKRGVERVADCDVPQEVW